MTSPDQPASLDPPPPWQAPRPVPARADAGGLDLRLFAHADRDALHELVSTSRQTLLPWVPWARVEHLTPESTTYTLERMARSYANPTDAELSASIGVPYAIVEGSTLLGAVGLVRFEPRWHSAEIGYMMHERHRRRGACTAATRAMISLSLRPQGEGGFGLRRVFIHAAAANVPSCRVPQKLGLHQAMSTRQDRWLPGVGWVDLMGWDVLASEWDCRSHQRRKG